MQPLIVTSGGAPCKVIGHPQYIEEIERIGNCILLDTSKADMASEIGPIRKSNPGYLIMHEGIDDTEFKKATGIVSGFSSLGDTGRKGMWGKKEILILALAMDSKLGITEKIWKTIEDQGLVKDIDSVMFISGLGGGTGSGSINGIASRYYESESKKGAGKGSGALHIVIGLLPTTKETEVRNNRLGLNTVWALYELMRPIERPNPLILLDNDAMDKNDPTPKKPVMDVISMLCDWRPFEDAGNFLSRYRASKVGAMVMAPYYASISKTHLRDISQEDIDISLLNFKPDKNVINPYDDPSGRWLMSINEQDLQLGTLKVTDRDSATGGMYILTKGIPDKLRLYLREKICKILGTNTDSDIQLSKTFIDKPKKAEFMILTMFDSPLELTRIKELVSSVKGQVDKLDFDTEFRHVVNSNAKKELTDYVKAMIKDLTENLESPEDLLKWDIKYLDGCFRLVRYEEEKLISCAA